VPRLVLALAQLVERIDLASLGSGCHQRSVNS
jgi:hypothetical protein